MINSKRKFATVLATGALLLTAFAPAALAQSKISISGNGTDSWNRITLNENQSHTFSQMNRADISNGISVDSNTGRNSARSNTGGNIDIQSGDIHTSTHVSNLANINSITSGNNGGGGSNHGGGMENEHFKTSLNGNEEVPKPGDPDGKGKAKVTIDMNQNKLCVDLKVRNIDPATAAHIHEAPKGASGPVIVTLPTPNAQGNADGCVSVDHNQLMEIHENPSDYYVNVHNPAYPGGAVRGQL